MAKEKKKRGLFKRNDESSTPTPEIKPEITESITNDIFSEEVSEPVVVENVSEPEFIMPSKPEPKPVVEEPVKEVEPKEEQKEAAQAPVVETSAPEKIENLLNQPTVPEQLKSVTATSNHSDEMKLEKFLRLRRGPQPLNVIHHMEMMSSGINMTKIGLLEGKVGKFKLKRSFVAEAWTMTVE